MNIEMFKIIDFAFDNYEKISAFKFGAGELYMKVYSKKPHDDILAHFKAQNFNVITLEQTERDPKLIDNDIEEGIELFIDFDIPNRPMLTFISNESE